MKDLYIMDYCTAIVHHYFVESHIDVDDEYISSLGFNLNQVEWMYGNIDLVFHRIK